MDYILLGVKGGHFRKRINERMRLNTKMGA